jgi:glucose-1-phosphate thymidylyltransferase
MDKDVRPCDNLELVGVIPAAGNANRLSHLPCSKEILPVGFCSNQRHPEGRLMVACEYLLESMKTAGATNIHIIIRDGKWDIPSCLKNGAFHGLNLSYLLMDIPFGVPYTIDCAYPFVRDQTVLFGFPDILFEPVDAFDRLIRKLGTCDADIVLGLYEVANPQKMDMVELDDKGEICSIHIKPEQTTLKYTWIMAVWRSEFTLFLHDFVRHHYQKISRGAGSSWDLVNELYLGHIIQKAMDEGINVDKVIFEKYNYIDIGTPEDLQLALRGGIPGVDTVN